MRFPGVVPPAGSSKLVRFIVTPLAIVIAMGLVRVHKIIIMKILVGVIEGTCR